MTEEECPEYEQCIAGLHSRLDPEGFTTAWTEGGAMDIEGAIRYAVAAR